MYFSRFGSKSCLMISGEIHSFFMIIWVKECLFLCFFRDLLFFQEGVCPLNTEGGCSCFFSRQAENTVVMSKSKPCGSPWTIEAGPFDYVLLPSALKDFQRICVVQQAAAIHVQEELFFFPEEKKADSCLVGIAPQHEVAFTNVHGSNARSRWHTTVLQTCFTFHNFWIELFVQNPAIACDGLFVQELSVPEQEAWKQPLGEVDASIAVLQPLLHVLCEDTLVVLVLRLHTPQGGHEVMPHVMLREMVTMMVLRPEFVWPELRKCFVVLLLRRRQACKVTCLRDVSQTIAASAQQQKTRSDVLEWWILDPDVLRKPPQQCHERAGLLRTAFVEGFLSEVRRCKQLIAPPIVFSTVPTWATGSFPVCVFDRLRDICDGHASDLKDLRYEKINLHAANSIGVIYMHGVIAEFFQWQHFAACGRSPHAISGKVVPQAAFTQFFRCLCHVFQLRNVRPHVLFKAALGMLLQQINVRFSNGNKTSGLCSGRGIFGQNIHAKCAGFQSSASLCAESSALAFHVADHNVQWHGDGQVIL